MGREQQKVGAHTVGKSNLKQQQPYRPHVSFHRMVSVLNMEKVTVIFGRFYSTWCFRIEDFLFLKQAGTGPSRRHVQGSKIAKGLPSVNLQYSKIEKPKKWTEWHAKRGGGTSEIVNIFVTVEGGPFGEKTNYRKKVSQCRKTERGDPSGFLNTHSLVKYQRN